MTDLSPARDPQKTRARKADDAPGRVFGWPDVVQALQHTEARSVALTRYRSAGWSPDDFGRRPGARQAMAVALSYAEDLLELRGARAERAAVRRVRRAIECEGDR
jgi:hypothetical protein